MLAEVLPVPTTSTIKLNLTHSILKIQIPEVRFDIQQTISSVKV